MKEVKLGNFTLTLPEEKEEPKATPKQISYIHSLVNELGWTDKEYRDYLHKHFWVKSSKELSKSDASRLIENLKYIKRYGIDEIPEALPDFGCEF